MPDQLLEAGKDSNGRVGRHSGCGWFAPLGRAGAACRRPLIAVPFDDLESCQSSGVIYANARHRQCPGERSCPGVRRRMGRTCRPGLLLPADRASRLGRSDLHAHLGARARGRSPLPDQPVRHDVRRGHRIEPREDRSRRSQGDAHSPHEINPAGFTIHSAVHEAREDAGCVLHLHTLEGIAVSAQKAGLLSISQQATLVIQSLSYHDYEGLAMNPDEKATDPERPRQHAPHDSAQPRPADRGAQRGRGVRNDVYAAARL